MLIWYTIEILSCMLDLEHIESMYWSLSLTDTNCCTRNICGNERPFEMAIMDNTGREVIHLSSPLRCHSCWFPCCLKKVEVQAPPGNVIGYVRQSWSICKPAYHIQDANDETVLKIQGPCFTCNICGDVEFQVHSADGDIPVGQIRKQWTGDCRLISIFIISFAYHLLGIAKEMFTDADNFGITFPLDLDVNVKATLLGAIFLIVSSLFQSSFQFTFPFFSRISCFLRKMAIKRMLLSEWCSHPTPSRIISFVFSKRVLFSVILLREWK